MTRSARILMAMLVAMGLTGASGAARAQSPSPVDSTKTVYAYDLGVGNSTLDGQGNSVPGVLSDYSPGSFLAQFYQNSGKIAVVDLNNDPLAGFNSGTGRNFSLSYQFSVGTTTAVSAVIDQLSNVAITSVKLVGANNSAVADSVSADLQTLSAAGLTAGGQYSLVVNGSFINSLSPSQMTVLGGNISAVPIPGAAFLFGSGLLGLGGLSRRRRQISAASKTFGAVAGALAVGVAGGAQASTTSSLEQVPLTILSAPVAGETLTLYGKDQNNGQFKAYDAVQANGAIVSQINGPTGVTTSGTNLTYQYDFKVAAAQKVDLFLTSTNLTVSAANVTLTDLNSSSGFLPVTATAISDHTLGYLELVANLPSTTDTYRFSITVPRASNSAFTAFGPVSSVPIPGAVVLFGSGLVGLAALGRRRASKESAISS